MKAITIWQPWASLIAIGAKQYETRSWETKYRGPIAIHAAKKDPCKMPILAEPFETALNEELEKAGLAFSLLPRGRVIATAELVNCHKIELSTTGGTILVRNVPNGYVTQCPLNTNDNKREMLFGDWTPGRYAWELANVRLLPKPIRAKGAQRLWNWDEKDPDDQPLFV